MRIVRRGGLGCGLQSAVMGVETKRFARDYGALLAFGGVFYARPAQVRPPRILFEPTALVGLFERVFR